MGSICTKPQSDPAKSNVSNQTQAYNASVIQPQVSQRTSGAVLVNPGVPDEFVNIEDFYIVKEELGKGAFSVVKKAVDKKTNAVVALKLIPNAVFNKNRSATEREVKILQQIGDHPHIVKLIDVHKGKKHVAITMELLTGGELFERICQKEKYTEEDARKITKQLLEAIAFLHSKKIAHRDLKPENAIFVTPDEHSILKVSDFGFANVYDPANRFVATCGTPLYVAPEILDCTPYDFQCDMWSLGVMVYVLLCGYPPFYAETDADLYAQIRNADYHFLSPAWDKISADARDFISRCFHLIPQKRITAAEALKHKWISTIDQPRVPLPEALDELKRTQCKRKLTKAIDAVIAMNRLERYEQLMSEETK